MALPTALPVSVTASPVFLAKFSTAFGFASSGARRSLAERAARPAADRAGATARVHLLGRRQGRQRCRRRCRLHRRGRRPAARHQDRRAVNITVRVSSGARRRLAAGGATARMAAGFGNLGDAKELSARGASRHGRVAADEAAVTRIGSGTRDAVFLRHCARGEGADQRRAAIREIPQVHASPPYGTGRLRPCFPTGCANDAAAGR